MLLQNQSDDFFCQSCFASQILCTPSDPHYRRLPWLNHVPAKMTIFILINKHKPVYYNKQEDKCATAEQLKHRTAADRIFLHNWKLQHFDKSTYSSSYIILKIQALYITQICTIFTPQSHQNYNNMLFLSLTWTKVINHHSRWNTDQTIWETMGMWNGQTAGYAHYIKLLFDRLMLLNYCL